MNNQWSKIGQRTLTLLEGAGLVVVGVATVVAFGQEIMAMATNLKVTLADLLLLFIYLEVLTMIGLYLSSGHLPIRMPLYIGMVALARYLALDMKQMDAWRMLAVAGAVLLLAAAVLLIRYGHVRFPYDYEDESAKADSE